MAEADAADAVATEVAVGGWRVAVRLAAAVLIGEAAAVGEAATAAGLGVAARPGSSPQAATKIRMNDNSHRRIE